MQLTTKYEIGQRVWGIGRMATTRNVNCLTCERTGKVNIGGEEFVCPKCGGNSQHRQFAGQKWVVTETGAIGQIEGRALAQHYAETWDQDMLRVTYMVDTTGVRGGTVWEESNLWPSREEAQAECDRRNADTNWADDEAASR